MSSQSAANPDPVEFRLRHLKDPRARAVNRGGRAKIRLEIRRAGRWCVELRASAFARYKNLGCYVAVVTEVDIESAPRVTRAWAAVDVGLVVNPDGVINQIEGGIIQAAEHDAQGTGHL